MRIGAVLVIAGVTGCASAQTTETNWTALRSQSDVPSAPTPQPATERGAMSASIFALPKSRAKGADENEVRVTAPRLDASSLGEERLVGSNEQPEWTTERRWAKTRAYVLAPGQIEVEQWWKLQTPRGSRPDHFWQTEVGIGFEGGWQLDLYENYGKNPGGPVKHEGVQAEVRYALAKWGEIPANPTLYLEYVANQRAADKVEAKVLFADDFGPRWHWGSNLVFEQETSGARETELALSGAVSYTILDSKFSVGAEFNAERVTGEGFKNNPVNEFLIGPAFQWRPTENSHIDLSPLFGFTKSDRVDPRFELWLIFGWDFGPEQPGHRGPASTRGR